MVVTEQLVNGLLVGCIYALFAVGLTLSLGVMRVLNVAHGAVLGLAGILAIQASGTVPGTGTLVGLTVFAMLVGAGCGLAIDFLAIEPAKRAENLSDSQIERATLIGTLAFLFVFESIATTRTHAQAVRIPSNVFSSKPVEILGITLNNARIGALVAAVVVFGAMTFVVRRTQVGRALRATALDHEAAEYLGVNVRLYSSGASAVAGALAGLAGVLLVASLGALDFTTGENLLHRGFVIVILGGIGSIEGSLIGGLLLGLGEGLTSYYIGSQWQAMVPIVLFVVLIMVRPKGIFGTVDVRKV